METFLEFMLGPFRSITNFYFENQLILNTIVIGFALYKIIGKKKAKQDETAS
ncbi:hypothetical protein [Virgibacillus tibetensis]